MDDEAAEIAFLRQQRLQLKQQLEGRRRRASEVLGAATPGLAGLEEVAPFGPLLPDMGGGGGAFYPGSEPAHAHSQVPARARTMPGEQQAHVERGKLQASQAEEYGRGTALYEVQNMVLDCIIGFNLELPVDSTAIVRRIKKRESLGGLEHQALEEVGGGAGEHLRAVEIAISSMAEGPSPLIEAEDFSINGIARKMVLSLHRKRILEVFPSVYTGTPQAPNVGPDPVRSHSGPPSERDPMGGWHPGPGPSLPDNMMGQGPLGNPPPQGFFNNNFARPGVFVPSGPHPGGLHGPWNRGPPAPSYGFPPGYPPQGGGYQAPHQGLGPQNQQPGGAAPPPKGVEKKTSKGRGGWEEEADPEAFLESLLSKKTFKEAQQSRKGEELMELLQKPTAMETARIAKFKTKGGSMVKEYCSLLTREDCNMQLRPMEVCEKLHFRRIIQAHTDVTLGDCSFLDTCRHMKTCKYIHYEVDPTSDPGHMGMLMNRGGPPEAYWRGMPGATVPPPSQDLNPFHPPSRFERPPRPEYCSQVELGESQWVNCDIRTFELEVLGQFGVIMADPPWDIHMDLPYGTMADDEMRQLRVQVLQTDGLIFLWVTGRAMELGRECLELWGYKRVEEIIWVKTNQLQKVIRTGRTGHWLNHSKEHCLVGIKGNPLVNRNIDTDVVVAEVRETSRKPDEMYSLIERISPRTRKIELFARMHNTHAGWISLGNQLDGVRLVDPVIRKQFREKYPGIEVKPPDSALRT